MTIRPVNPKTVQRSMSLFTQAGVKLKVIDTIVNNGKHIFTTISEEGDLEVWEWDEHDYSGDGNIQAIPRLYLRSPQDCQFRRKVYTDAGVEMHGNNKTN